MHGEVLVAIANKILDFNIARDQHWYRIPLSSVEKWLKDCWPPRWLALYQTKIFGPEAYAVNYFTKVIDHPLVPRWRLFPEQPRDETSDRLYYQLCLEPLQKLPNPIPSLRLRRIVFIPTTLQKLNHSDEINDLFDESFLEDFLWREIKNQKIPAERQEFVQVKKHDYALDFAVYCEKGKLDLETDGDTWHANSIKSNEDNIRDNDLKTGGWQVLRFTSRQIREETQSYCIDTIIENINNLGGLDEGRIAPRKIDKTLPPGSRQLSFDDLK